MNFLRKLRVRDAAIIMVGLVLAIINIVIDFGLGPNIILGALFGAIIGYGIGSAIDHYREGDLPYDY